jgi:hypothetical protein
LNNYRLFLISTTAHTSSYQQHLEKQDDGNKTSGFHGLPAAFPQKYAVMQSALLNEYFSTNPHRFNLLYNYISAMLNIVFLDLIPSEVKNVLRNRYQSIFPARKINSSSA